MVLFAGEDQVELSDARYGSHDRDILSGAIQDGSLLHVWLYERSEALERDWTMKPCSALSRCTL
jgi:hypothetical protein